MSAEDSLGTMLGLVGKHRAAGNNNPSSPKFEAYLTDLATTVDDIHRVRYQYHPPATIDERLSFLVSTVAAIDRRTEPLVSDISGLQAAVDKLGADATADHDAIIAAFAAQKTSLDDLTAQVAALTAGQISQATIDALTASAAKADQAFNDTAAAVVPVVVTPPTVVSTVDNGDGTTTTTWSDGTTTTGPTPTA